MPNWCKNIITIKGNNKDIEDFKDALWAKPAVYRGEEDNPIEYSKEPCRWTMNGIVPVPDEILEKGYYNNDIKFEDSMKMLHGKMEPCDGYHWQIANWGTKWDLDSSQTYIEDGKGELCITTYTAWNPIAQFIEKASAVYPELEFTIKYEETGNQLLGHFIFKNGKMLEEVTSGGTVEGMVDYYLNVDNWGIWDILLEFIYCDDEYYRETYDMIVKKWLDKNSGQSVPSFDEVLSEIY